MTKKSFRAHHVITPNGGRKATRKLARPKGMLALLRVSCRPDAIALLQALPLRGVEKAVARAKRGRR